MEETGQLAGCPKIPAAQGFPDMVQFLGILESQIGRPTFFRFDEIDLHLHPKWQRQIVRNLTVAFPKCQFIATTHSPQVIGEVDRNRRRKDRRVHAEDHQTVLTEGHHSPFLRGPS